VLKVEIATTEQKQKNKASMKTPRVGVLLRTFVGEADRAAGRAHYATIVEEALARPLIRFT
jgi:hypothetical protein